MGNRGHSARNSFQKSRILSRNLAGPSGVNVLAVEQRAGGLPGLQAEAEAVGEPEVVEAQVGEEMLALPAEERAQRRALRNAVGKAGVGGVVGVERGIAADEAPFAHRAGQADFVVLFVLERRMGEFAARIERGPHPDRLAGHLRPTSLSAARSPPDRRKSSRAGWARYR